jgi:hypothetical protein
MAVGMPTTTPVDPMVAVLAVQVGTDRLLHTN